MLYPSFYLINQNIYIKIEPPVKNEPFLRNVSMRFREQRQPFIISFKFKAHF